ncbi:MAG: ANL family adenylate-forming protein [Bacteroidales bacterium]
MDFFLKDTTKNQLITWNELISDLSGQNTYNPYCKSEDYYQVFRHIITSMLIGKEVILLDSDFTDDELIRLTGYSAFDSFNEPLDEDLLKVKDKGELLERLNKTGNNWKISIFTSGTTGLPKKVTHSFDSITRFVKVSERYRMNIWGFAYNPTHMAGIQVFFQALLNGNAMVRLFNLPPKEILGAIKENEITNISATPTFYRLLLPCDESFKSIERITSGGEKFNENTIAQLKAIFPNAKITNVYASTEAGTIFASENDIFTIKPGYEHLIRIEGDELFLHKSLIGSTDISIGEWYNTGDVVEVLAQNPIKFRFISRKSDMINVGGYKVNPLEVEETILTFPGIVNARVYAKRNSVLGNIICCEVVCNTSEIDEPSIRAFLQSRLQEFKIPRIIRFVNELSVTRTGKTKRS